MWGLSAEEAEANASSRSGRCVPVCGWQIHDLAQRRRRGNLHLRSLIFEAAGYGGDFGLCKTKGGIVAVLFWVVGDAQLSVGLLDVKARCSGTQNPLQTKPSGVRVCVTWLFL